MSKQETALLEAKLNFMQEKFSNIEKLLVKHIDHEASQWDNLIERLDKRYDEKYASKLTQTIVYTMAGISLIGLLSSVGLLLQK